LPACILCIQAAAYPVKSRILKLGWQWVTQYRL
jgi:hypothetical protein